MVMVKWEEWEELEVQMLQLPNLLLPTPPTPLPFALAPTQRPLIDSLTHFERIATLNLGKVLPTVCPRVTSKRGAFFSFVSWFFVCFAHARLPPHLRVSVFDTPQLWGCSTACAPSTIAAGEALCNAITNVIAGARVLVDISTLWWIGTPGMPDGAFERAIAKGLASCQAPIVRIILGVPSGTNTKESDVEAWLKRITPPNAPFSIHVGRTHHKNPVVASWTHAKIVAADGKRSLVGGHNMWDGDYLKWHPVHDLSIYVEGPAARQAHAFCSEMWAGSLHTECISLRGGQVGRETPARQAVPDEVVMVGACRILALGRMGAMVPHPSLPAVSEFSHGTDAAVSARIMAICCARTRIRISQQALGFLPAVNGGFDFATTVALAAAARDGVQIDIVVSSDTEMAGYNGHLADTVPHLGRVFAFVLNNPNALPSRADLAGWLRLKQDTARDVVPTLGNKVVSANRLSAEGIAQFNSRFTIAPIHFAPNVNFWMSEGKKKLAGNHAKVYIIDETQFFAGSDNWYVSGTPQGLEEFGYLVEGDAVAHFISSYWTPLWNNSSPYALRAAPNMF